MLVFLLANKNKTKSNFNYLEEVWGIMNVPDPVSTIDGLLAATAKVNNCILVTRNVKDIYRCGVDFYNPFE